MIVLFACPFILTDGELKVKKKTMEKKTLAIYFHFIISRNIFKKNKPFMKMSLFANSSLEIIATWHFILCHMHVRFKPFYRITY